MARSVHSLSHYSAHSLSRYAPRSFEFKTLKFTLIAFMIINVFASIWVCFYVTDQAEWEYNMIAGDPRYESAVNTWVICVITFVVIADIVDLILLIGVWNDRKSWIVATAVLAFILSMFGISCVYTRGSITLFVIPFVITTLSILMYWMIGQEEAKYEVSRQTALRTGVKRFILVVLHFKKFIFRLFLSAL